MPKTKLQELRIKKSLSQSQLSKLSGVNLRTLQDFEQGRKPLTNAKGEMLYRLSMALDSSVEDLISDKLVEIDISSTNSTRHLEKYYTLFSSKALYDKYYSFPVVVPDTSINMQRIYPTKQSLILSLHEVLAPDYRISSIMLFGSSVTMRCTQNSDTDLAIRLLDKYIDNETKNSISEVVQEICNWNADILWYDRIDKTDRIYHDICKGVQIV